MALSRELIRGALNGTLKPVTPEDILKDLKVLRRRWRTEATRCGKEMASDSSAHFRASRDREQSVWESTANQLDEVIGRLERSLKTGEGSNG